MDSSGVGIETPNIQSFYLSIYPSSQNVFKKARHNLFSANLRYRIE